MALYSNVKKASTILLATSLLYACNATLQQTNQAQVSEQTTSAQAQLQAVIDSEHQYRIDSSPFYQREAGEGNSNSRLTDYSPKALATNHEKVTGMLNQLAQIDQNQLTDKAKIDYAIMHYNLKNEADQYKFNDHYVPLTAEAGFHAYLSFINRQVVFKTEQDYQDYISRLNAIPTLFEQQTHWLKQGLATGITQPQVVLKGFEQSISAFISETPEQSSYFMPFNKLPDYFDDSTKAQLIANAKVAISEKVIPSYQAFYDFMVNEYIPGARQTIAAHDLPNGKDFYQNRVEHYTTLKLSADEIHNIGLEEVARIRAEMQQIIKEVKFEGSFADFVSFLRNDPQFYATTPEQLLKEASFIAKKMDARLPALFKTLPRTPYGVIAVPDSIAPKYTTGRYSGPSSETEAGHYWVNTYALERRPLYVLEALTLHEAVPGHHLQGSLASEMEGVDKFRQETYISAFGEGWGLYSEWLGIEAGFYQDPYSNFGRLTYEMWRACRLVVDTGMHAKGWSRDRAIDYLASNTALSMHNVTTEIDRYISWPGQALSYKMGEITIRRLRAEAEQRLGQHFDVREFHDKVLEDGSIPLTLLEEKIMRYIENKAKESSQS